MIEEAFNDKGDYLRVLNKIARILSDTRESIAVLTAFATDTFMGGEHWGYHDEGWRTKTLSMFEDDKGWENPVTVIVMANREGE